MGTLRFSRAMPVDGVATWSEALDIASSPAMLLNWADFPSVTILDDGSMAAHWLERSSDDGHAYDVLLAVSPDGGRTWSEPIRPHLDGTATEHGFVSLLPRAGGFDVFWLDGREYATDGPHPGTQLRHARWTEGRLGSETVLDDRVCDCCQTEAVETDSGALVVYRDRSSDEIRDIAVVREEGGTWIAPATVGSDRWRIAACPVNGPAAAARGSSVAIAWHTRAGDEPRVLVAFSRDSGRTLGPPLRVDDGGAVGRVDLAWLDDDRVLVTWLADRRSGAGIMLRSVGPGGSLGPALEVAKASADRSSGFPRLAVLDGAAFVARTDTADHATGARVLWVPGSALAPKPRRRRTKRTPAPNARVRGTVASRMTGCPTTAFDNAAQAKARMGAILSRCQGLGSRMQ